MTSSPLNIYWITIGYNVYKLIGTECECMNTSQFASKDNNTMDSIEAATKLSKDQRVQQLAKLYGCSTTIDRVMSNDDSDSDTDFPSSSAKIPFHNACCHCSKPRRIQIKSRDWRYRFLLARYATTVLFSMIILLASAQEVNNNKKASRGAALTLNESSPLSSSSSSSSHATVPNENRIGLEPDSEPEQAPESANQTLGTTTIPNKAPSRRTNKGLEMPAGLLSSGGKQGFSMIRNSLIGGDTVLQRQLREKAKQDSLESIKMHILMRLNLKKLPNITKPVSVPQTILEKFYKNYNASLSSSFRDHNNKPDSASTSRTGLYVPEEIVSDSSETTSNVTKNIFNSQYTSAMQYTSNQNQNSSPEMQSDDPNNFKEFQFIYNLGFDNHQNHKSTDSRSNDDDDNSDDNDDVEYESILSHISSIYVFPEQPHVRHNRKSDLLRFKFSTGYSDISHVTLHLYLRGLEWISAHQPKIIEEIADYHNKDIVVALHRAIRRSNSTSYTHKAKIFEFRHKIPSGLGQWVNVDLKPLFGTEYTMGRSPTQLQEIFIKGVEPWMRPLVVTTDSTSKNPLTVHIEIGSRKKHRRKRSVYLDCIESDHELRCCRYPLKVNFTSFGWHFVVAPDSFDAYFCSGECRVGYLEQYPHTHLAALTTSATPCCSPTKMSSLSLLYFDESHHLVLSVIPNMSVEGCSCS